MTDLRIVSAMPLKCPGVGRDAENDKSLCFYFNRRPTDGEMRYLHEVMQRAAACRAAVGCVQEHGKD